MKKTLFPMALLLMILLYIPHAAGAELLIPVGQVIALELENDCVTVVSIENGGCSELQPGDQIQTIDGKPVRCAGDVKTALNRSGGTVEVEVLRHGASLRLRLSPQITADGPRLGVYLRQGVTGIGTVTYYDPEDGCFAALGHGVNTPEGSLVKMEDGRAYPARVQSVRRGTVGAPGQLMGALRSGDPLGTLSENTPVGVFGEGGTWSGEPIPTADLDQIRTGSATILSTIHGDTPQTYSVEILKIYPNANQTGRNFLLKVTDPQLLQTTGGIVQGMSGSPIIQDGKLVGAVTHVLVNDPTTGYGIFIENMLDAAA